MSFQVSIYDRFIWISIYAYFFVDLYFYMDGNKQKKERKKKEKNWPKKNKKVLYPVQELP